MNEKLPDWAKHFRELLKRSKATVEEIADEAGVDVAKLRRMHDDGFVKGIDMNELFRISSALSERCGAVLVMDYLFGYVARVEAKQVSAKMKRTAYRGAAKDDQAGG